jgi:hypothetical protein
MFLTILFWVGDISTQSKDALYPKISHFNLFLVFGESILKFRQYLDIGRPEMISLDERKLTVQVNPNTRPSLAAPPHWITGPN